MGVTTISPILTTDISLPLQALQLVQSPSFSVPFIYRNQVDRRRNDHLERVELSGRSWRIPCDQAPNKGYLDQIANLSRLPHSRRRSVHIYNLRINDTLRCPSCRFCTLRAEASWISGPGKSEITSTCFTIEVRRLAMDRQLTRGSGQCLGLVKARNDKAGRFLGYSASDDNGKYT